MPGHWDFQLALRRLGLAGTELAHATCQTIRLKLWALIRVTCRKVWIALDESYPYRKLFHQAHENLRRLTPWRMPP